MVKGQNFLRPELGSCTKHEKYTMSLVQVGLSDLMADIELLSRVWKDHL